MHHVAKHDRRQVGGGLCQGKLAVVRTGFRRLAKILGSIRSTANEGLQDNP